MIWRFAGTEISNSPWFGIGLKDWSRPPGMSFSVDSIWLVQALTFGIPASLLLGLTLISATFRNAISSADRALDPYLEKLRTGLTAVLLMIAFIGCTVHFWGAMLTFLGVLIGIRTTIEELRAEPSPRRKRKMHQYDGLSRGRPRTQSA